MSSLVEVPITVYIDGDDEEVDTVELCETEMTIDLSDIKWVYRTDSGEVYAKDFSGKDIEINVEYEEFRKLWLRGRRVVKMNRKAKGYRDMF